MKIENNSLFPEVLANQNLSVALNGYVVTDGKWYQRPLRSPWSRIYYVLDGEGVFLRGDGKEMKIEPGYVYFAPCGATYGFEGRPSLTKLFFHVNVIMPGGYDLFSRDTRIMKFKRSREELSALLGHYRSENPVEQMMVAAELWRVVAAATSESFNTTERSMAYSETVNSAIEYIRKNLSADLKASDVANSVFCSVGSLNERFSKELGTSVAKYIDGLLMFEAGRMLAKGNKTVGEVSLALGYCDQFYFSRRFTKHFSITPRDYRKLKMDI